MAKWGEGDPRWIVEERPDATNVNNWHWTEKNATAWSKDKLKELLVGVEIKDASTGSVKLTEFERLEGEASANNRKAKLIFFYEWDIKIKFEGKKYGDGEKEVTGAVKVANLSDENGPDDLDISVSSDDSSVKAMVRAIGVPLVRDKLKQYMESLRAEFAKDMILPTKNNNDSANVNVNTAKTSPRLPKKEQKEAHHQMERWVFDVRIEELKIRTETENA
jgi:activator of HSP90 ATPase